MGRGTVFVISAPSGAGKSTLVRRLMESVEGLSFSVSHTTRGIRPGEVDGVHYNFTDEAGFRSMVGEGAFVEWAQVHGNLYGTSLGAIESELEAGRDVVLDIDVQGADQVVEKLEGCATIFIMPPGWDVLEARLRGRGDVDDEVIARRMKNAREEVERATDYDFVIVNDDLEEAAHQLKCVVLGVRERAAAAV